ncbi:hypothetical protein BBD41_19750 [Paenibacillus ihbetae]|uniref:Uncharacterized protein n=1 Tax=Paenibacillus ihbetae TaxID=1870820 RepID=A0A1B2E3R1_9BACL|nr:hypothetical protein [Paenibacillus ihbetae]ANY74618.1 hypothetical protein BBD41_19750 [Paenibacillus ihbetae]
MENRNLIKGDAIVVEYDDNTFDLGIFVKFVFVEYVEDMKCFLMYERSPIRTDSGMKEEIRFVEINGVKEVRYYNP